METIPRAIEGNVSKSIERLNNTWEKRKGDFLRTILVPREPKYGNPPGAWGRAKGGDWQVRELGRGKVGLFGKSGGRGWKRQHGGGVVRKKSYL